MCTTEGSSVGDRKPVCTGFAFSYPLLSSSVHSCPPDGGRNRLKTPRRWGDAGGRINIRSQVLYPALAKVAHERNIIIRQGISGVDMVRGKAFPDPENGCCLHGIFSPCGSSCRNFSSNCDGVEGGAKKPDNIPPIDLPPGMIIFGNKAQDSMIAVSHQSNEQEGDSIPCP